MEFIESLLVFVEKYFGNRLGVAFSSLHPKLHSMQTTEWCQIPQTIGSYISPDYYLSLVNGYAQRHPDEQKAVFIPKEFILETLEKFPVVTGLRFMYGQKEGADPGSRTIILMACDNSTSDRHVPNLILVPKGYLTDTGERITLDQCWDLLTRQVDRMCSLIPDEPRKNVPRGTFFGINILKSLLDMPGCVGIQYHFGYNSETDFPPERYETVMEAVDINRKSLHVFAENGLRCPTVCAGSCPGTIDIPVGWPFTGAYQGQEQVSERALFEMFHYVSPPLFEAIQDRQTYKEHFSECFAVLGTGNVPEAKQVLKKQLDRMIEKYLFVNQWG
jgi:hypothetical protein